ncbi:MAG: 16S rRNA (cytidine(1402)-2'-O)-methyltransferase [Gammaproteobacteria bacterium]
MASAGCLYVVATPIGHLDDMSPRAVDTLRSVDVVAAEDTRHSGRLLAHFGIDTPMVSLHDHNEDSRSDQLVARMEQGDSVALISDAGTPLISDPGYTLLKKVRERQITVSPVPGASAVISALCVAGLPTDRFVFEGFLPAKSVARVQRLEGLKQESRTMVFYVSRHQATKQLSDCLEVFGAERSATLARELTKMHETISHGSLEELVVFWDQNPEQHKGELVLVVAGAPEATTDSSGLDALLTVLLEELRPKQAAKLAVKLTGCSRNEAYRAALALKA